MADAGGQDCGSGSFVSGRDSHDGDLHRQGHHHERGKGYGKQIMLHAIDAAIENFGATLIDIEAQEYAKGFYESVGFKQSSDTFMLDGIPHIKMTWRK